MATGSERFELRQAQHRVGLFTVNHDGVILVQVRGGQQIVLLIALIALQWPAIDALDVTLYDVLYQRESRLRRQTATPGRRWPS